MAEKEVQVVLFGLESEGDLRVEYPELSEIEEFKDLRVKEVRLCWLLGNRTSPIYKLSKKDRLFRSLEIVYGKNYNRRKDLEGIISGDIPDNLKDGIKRMESFNPEYRLKAKLMTEYMFEILNQMVVLNPNDLTTMDIDDKKKYTDLVVKVHDELPSMVKTLETSYGAKTIDKKTKKSVMVKINDLLR
tara:strand:+ start:6755 stop:7318 length:564 start_codon:yes stop_codon:yes gene_type:complete